MTAPARTNGGVAALAGPPASRPAWYALARGGWRDCIAPGL